MEIVYDVIPAYHVLGGDYYNSEKIITTIKNGLEIIIFTDRNIYGFPRDTTIAVGRIPYVVCKLGHDMRG